MNVRSMCTADVSSVLPDFVQDHLVIEQCYLNGSSSINIDNLNLQNLPDLNLEHQNMHFTMNQDRDSSSGKQPINQFPNLPDFTQGVINFQTGIQESCNSDRLPDFALNVGAHATSNLDCANDTNSSFISNSRRRVNVNETNEASHSNRSRTQMSSSPSVPLDLPSYESNCDSNPNIPIPFDLTIPVDDNCNSRTGNAPETVSKSLPDFLSDGPIKKELDDNLKSIRENAPPVPNGLLFSETPTVKVSQKFFYYFLLSMNFHLT